MNVVSPLASMPVLHAGTAGGTQDRWDLVGLGLITLAVVLVAWVMLDVVRTVDERDRPIEERSPARQLSRSTAMARSTPFDEPAPLAAPAGPGVATHQTHAVTEELMPEPLPQPALPSRRFGARRTPSGNAT